MVKTWARPKTTETVLNNGWRRLVAVGGSWSLGLSKKWPTPVASLYQNFNFLGEGCGLQRRRAPQNRVNWGHGSQLSWQAFMLVSKTCATRHGVCLRWTVGVMWIRWFASGTAFDEADCGTDTKRNRRYIVYCTAGGYSV